MSSSAKPKFKVDLPGSSWCAVVAEDGTHFYHNTQTQQSVWRADDNELRDAVTRFDRDVLLLLVAKARGLELEDSAVDLLARAQRRTTALEENITEEGTSLGGAEALAADPSRPPKSGLVSGYSSSEDSEDGDHDEGPDDPQQTTNVSDEPVMRSTDDLIPQEQDDDSESHESSGDENGIDLADLDDISSDEYEGQHVSNEQSEASFLNLLQESSLDPISPWETESLKIVNDPRFMNIDNNKDRKRLFDTWCSMTFSMKKYAVNDPLKGLKKETPFVEFMRFLESKECDRFFLDFKKKWRDVLDTLQLGDRDKERTYKEYVIFMKKSQQDREQIFKALLTGSKIFKKNLLASEDSKYALDSVPLDSLPQFDPEEVYAILHDLEKKLDIPQSVVQQTKYFLVSVKTRVRLIIEVSRLFLGP